jgi:DNA-binding transcriptional LysR family regulator
LDKVAIAGIIFAQIFIDRDRKVYMDTLQLQLFASISRTLNFSRTAEQFFISQPAVSHQIKMLENSLGVRLLNRSNHKVSLTVEGAELLPYADQMLKLSSVVENRLQNMAQGRWGHIRIAALSSTTYQLCDCLAKFYEQYPDIQVDIDLFEGQGIVSSLQRDDYDFYFALHSILSARNEYEYTAVCNDRLQLFVNRKIADTIDLSDWSTVGRHPFISGMQSDEVLSSRIRFICRNRGIEPRIINYYNRADTTLISVNAGIGIAIMPGELGRLYNLPNVIALPIEGDDAVHTSVFAWKKGKSTTVCDIFKSIVLSIFPS